MAAPASPAQQLGIGLHLETRPNGEQVVQNVKPGYDAEAKGIGAGTIIHLVDGVQVQG